MKRILLISLLSVLPFLSWSQEYDHSDQTLEFYYIAHDRTSPVDKICDFIKDRQKEATYYKDLAMIFYLASGDNPLVVKMNLPGDNRGDFQNIINALQQQMSHDINPRDDIRNITEIFNEIDFADNYGNPVFSSFQWVYFVTPLFWQMEYNEDVISALYFVLDLEKMPQDYLTIDIYYDNKDPLDFDKDLPFGLKDMCGPCNILPLL